MSPPLLKDLAEQLGVSPISLSRYRMGERVPNRNMMLKIKDELGWNLNEQHASVADGTYAADFRTYLFNKFGIPTGEDVTAS